MNTPRFPAIVTAAGAATRFQPFSTTVPKEMLPLGHTPAVEHVIIECLSAGATEVLVVTRPDDHVIPAHVHNLRVNGLPVETVAEDLGHGYGNATPLLTVRDRLVACETFAVAFGDDVLLNEKPCGRNLATMREQIRSGCEAVIAAQRIEPSSTRSFGIIDIRPEQPERVVAIRQRPEPSTVHDPLAVVSRLILRPPILERLEATDEAGGEVDLGIAAGKLATECPVRLHPITGDWVTVGDPQHYLDALRTYQRTHSTELATTAQGHQ